MSMQQLASGQASAEIPVNRNFQSLEHQAVYGQRQSAHSGLTWAFYGGRWGGFSVADGTLTLTDSTTNYVVVAIATGVASTSTATTNWNDSTNYARVYRITTAGGVVTNNSGSDFDYRAGPGGVHGGSGGAGSGDVATDAIWDAAGDLVVGTGANTAARLAAGTNGHVLTLAAGTPAWQPPSGSSGTKTYATFTPMTSQPPASNFATLDTRNSIAVLDFDDTTEESVFWVGVMPEAASLASGLIVNIFFMATTATSGDARFGAQFERMNTDEDSDSFDTATEATVATSGTSGIVTKLSITCTTIDSIAAGELYRLKIYRDTSGADTITGDVEVVAVEVRSAA